MASLLRTRVFCLRRAAATVPAAARPLSMTAARRHGESQSHDPEFEVEKPKEASLKHQKKGQGEWMDSLASDSEKHIKADKSGLTIKDAVAEAKKVFSAKENKDK